MQRPYRLEKKLLSVFKPNKTNGIERFSKKAENTFWAKFNAMDDPYMEKYNDLPVIHIRQLAEEDGN